MSNIQEGSSVTRAPLFDGTDYVFWKIRMETYLISLDLDVWNIVCTKYTVPANIPTTPDEKKQYEMNARAKHAILCGLTKDVFVKIMHCKSAHEIWEKIENIYQGNEKVKQSKILTLKTQFEEMKMKDNEKVAKYFLRIDEVVNGMRGLGEEVDEFTVVKKVIRTLLPKYETKVSALEEKKNFNKLTLDDLQGTLIAFEMRTSKSDNASSLLKESTFKTEKIEAIDSESNLSDTLEALLVRKLKKKYRAKLPLKCFNCGKAGHFATQYPNADQNLDDDQTKKHFRRKTFPKKKFNFNNLKKKKSLFSKEDSNDDSDNSLGDEGETLFMVEIEMPKILSSKSDSQMNSQSDQENCEINLEGELLCTLQEIKKLKKHISAEEKSSHNVTVSLQTEIDDSRRVIENLKSLLTDKENETQTLKKQVDSLSKQVEEHKRTIHLHNMLGKQKQLVGIGECSNFVDQNVTIGGKKNLFES
ncbi:uncharacterized protein LOC131874068 [Cryptomeria japonica]|uniref:uncharacterized protein LOC131874068 n=1 Tax=Cryptomeria japonica TaxID=3369 RepID=UPI0027DA4974|nr:uncharacterized protein LOC131874068 [Cryptomeria japonica]